jgi:hypothetical protein
MQKIGLAAGFTSACLVLAEVSRGWYDLAVVSAVASIAAGFGVWALLKSEG